MHIFDLLNKAIEGEGLVKVPDYALRHSIKSFKENRLIGKPMNTYEKKQKVLNCLFWSSRSLIPAVQSPLNSKFTKDMLNDCFVSKEGVYYLDVLALFKIEDRNLQSLIDIKNYLNTLREVILNVDSTEVFFQFYKSNHPLEVKFDICDNTEPKILSEENLKEINNIEIPEALCFYLDFIFRKTPFLRRNIYCWINLDDDLLLTKEESFEKFDRFYKRGQ